MGAEPTPQIPDIEALDKADAVLLGLLATLGKEVFRTKMVKLTYLLDDLSFRHDGTTMTGFRYWWDNYGPNAVGNEIVKRLDGLSERRLARTRVTQTPFGALAYGYRIDDKIDLGSVPLCVNDWALIHSVVHTFGHLNRDRIVQASKQTLPMKNAKQFQPIEFQPDPHIESLRASFWSNTDFVRETMAAMADKSERITLEELRKSVAQ